jgi:hypothetical protein
MVVDCTACNSVCNRIFIDIDNWDMYAVFIPDFMLGVFGLVFWKEVGRGGPI